MTAAGTFTAGLTGGTAIVDVITGAQALAAGDNPNLYALRTAQNITGDAGGNTLTLTSGGLIMTGTSTTIASAVLTGPQAGLSGNLTLAFGTAEGMLFNTGTGNVISTKSPARTG
ncbi:MAG: hypothetical protein QM775_13185 [Pirellulales bacterium]